MNPNTLGIVLLVCLVVLAEVKSYERARKTRRAVAESARKA